MLNKIFRKYLSTEPSVAGVSAADETLVHVLLHKQSGDQKIEGSAYDLNVNIIILKPEWRSSEKEDGDANEFENKLFLNITLYLIDHNTSERADHINT